MGFSKNMGLLFIGGITLFQCARHVQLPHDETYTYQYTKRGVEIGTEVFSLEKREGHLVVKADLDIAEGDNKQKGSSELVVENDGTPVAYFRQMEITLPEFPDQSGLWELRFAFRGREVLGEIIKDNTPRWKGSVGVKEKKVYCIDNNALFLLATLVKGIYPKLRKEAEYSVNAFHFSEVRVRNLTFTKVKDGTYHCTIGPTDIGDLSIRDGLLVKHEDPRKELVIRLK